MTRRWFQVVVLASILLGANSGCCRLCDRWRDRLCDEEEAPRIRSRLRSDDPCEPKSLRQSGSLRAPDDCYCD